MAWAPPENAIEWKPPADAVAVEGPATEADMEMYKRLEAQMLQAMPLPRQKQQQVGGPPMRADRRAVLNDLAKQMANAPPLSSIGRVIAMEVDPWEYAEFEQMLYEHAKVAKPSTKMSFKQKTLNRITRGVEEIAEEAVEFALPERELDDRAELFRRRIDAIKEGVDPFSGKDAPWYKTGYYEALHQTPKIALSIAAGGAGGAGAARLGLGRLGVWAAESAGVGATYYKQMRDDTYYELLTEGVEPRLASRTAASSALLQSIIEGGIIANPFARRMGSEAVSRTVRDIILSNMKRFGGEWSEEFAQSLVDETAKAIATGDKGAEEVLKTSLKQGFDALPTLAYLMGPGMVVGGTAEASQLQAQRQQRVADIQRWIETGYIPAEVGKELGIQGNTRTERMANAKAQLEDARQRVEQSKPLPRGEQEAENAVQEREAEEVPVPQQPPTARQVEEEVREPDRQEETQVQEEVAWTPPEDAVAVEEEKAPPVEEAPQEAVGEPEAAPETTGVRHAKTAELREKTGMPKRVPVTPKTWEEADAEAAQLMADDPTYAPRLAEDLVSNPRTINQTGQFVLNRHLRDLENRRKAGEDVYDEMRIAIAASEESAGSEVGRSLQARQAEYTEDYSLQDMMRRHRRELDEDPSREQVAKYQELADEIERLKAENEGLRQQDVVPELEQRIKDLEGEVAKAKKAKRGPRKDAMKQKRTDAVNEFKKAWDALHQVGAIYDPKQEADKLAAIVKAAGKVIKAYVESGVRSLIELKARLRQDIGDLSAAQIAEFEKEWNRQKPATRVEASMESQEIGEAAEELMKAAVASGITNREEVVDAVQEVLDEIGLDRSETMRAMTRYGPYARPRREVASGRLQEVRGEIRQLVRLEDLEAGLVPENVESRREQGEEEKELIREVYKAMKRSGLSTTDPETQLKTPLTRKKTATRKRISELDQEIADLISNIKQRTPLKPDGTRTELEVDEELLDMQAELNDKYAERDRLRDQSPEYQAKKAAKQRENYKKSLARREAFWEQRLREAKGGKFPAKRPSSPYTEEFQDNLLKIDDLKKQYLAEVEAEKRRQWNAGQWIGHGIKEVGMTLPRGLMAGLEMSPVLRQGVPYTSGHPILAFFSVVDAVKSVFVQRMAVAAHEKIEDRPNYKEYLQNGIEFTTEAGKVVEEMYESEILNWLAKTEHWLWIPGRWPAQAYRALERGVRVFSNSMRADLYDINKRDTLAAREFFEKLGVPTRAWSKEDMQEAARTANIMSGRGTGMTLTGKGKNLLDVLAFAKRYVWSRLQMNFVLPFQLLTPKGIGQWNGDAAMRVAHAKMYGQALLGGLTHLGALYFLLTLLADDDEDKPTIELSPRETDWLRLQAGETRIDVLGGVPKYYTLLMRLLSGHKTVRQSDGSLEVVPLTEGYKRADSEIGRETRYKLSAPVSGIIDFLAGRTAVWEELPQNRLKRLGAVIAQRIHPMTYPDMWKAEQELGWKRGTIAAMEAFFGAGVGTYGDRTRYREASPEQRKEMVEKDLKKVAWDDPETPAQADFLTEEQLKRFKDKWQEKRGLVMYNAVYPGESEEKVATRDKDRKNLATMRAKGVTHEEAQRLLWKYTGIREFTGETRRKHSYALGKLFGATDEEVEKTWDDIGL